MTIGPQLTSTSMARPNRFTLQHHSGSLELEVTRSRFHLEEDFISPTATVLIQRSTSSQTSLEPRSSMTLTLASSSATVSPHSTSFQCQDIKLMVQMTHPKIRCTTVMLIRSVEFTVQSSISWRLTLTLIGPHLILATLQIQTDTTITVIEVAPVQSMFKISSCPSTDQVISMKSTRRSLSLLRLIGRTIQKEKLLDTQPNSPRTVFQSQCTTTKASPI